MPSLNAQAQGDLALGIVDASEAAFTLNRGFSSITDNGVGDLTLVLKDQQNLANSAICSVTPLNNAPAIVGAEPVSTTGLRVRTYSVTTVPAVAAADIDFYVRITPIATN